ncbi:hypothetical protein EUGRSUZ_E00231 [Eucalyptus grandis]|uniref:Uncharacterized protein n=2 Tax=Eucalyptus grandis TaxID=71139 RepID=A0ACC3KQP9_EUCGR|nr:hypothetical protein EUGRSUZ_E00231 [Eucalyptus grandis]
MDISGPRYIHVDANDTSLTIQLKHSGSLMTLMEIDSLFDRIKSAETIWLVVLLRILVVDGNLDDDQLVINLKKQDPELKWPDIVESWESSTAGSTQLLRGTSIYIAGDSTEINHKVAKELAVGLGYTPLETKELLETFAKQTIDSWVLAEGYDAIAEAQDVLLESLSRYTHYVMQYLYAGFTVWLSTTEATDEDSAKKEARRHIEDGSLGYANADVVVKLQGWDVDYSKIVARASLRALKRLVLSDRKLPGKFPSNYTTHVLQIEWL